VEARFQFASTVRFFFGGARLSRVANRPRVVDPGPAEFLRGFREGRVPCDSAMPWKGWSRWSSSEVRFCSPGRGVMDIAEALANFSR